MTAEELIERSFKAVKDSDVDKISPDEHARMLEAKNDDNMGKEQKKKRHPAKPINPPRKPGAPKRKAAAALSRKGRLATIPLDLIIINENNPRLNCKEGLDELRANIEHVGLLHPITVAKIGERYLILDGQRRFRAMQALGMKEIDAYVIEISEEKREMCPLAADVGTQKLRPLEVARECQRLMEATGMKQQDLTQILNVGKSTISGYMSLGTLPEEIQRDYAGERKDSADGESDEFGRRTSKGGIGDSRVLTELAKVPGPYQIRLYYRLKRERAKEQRPKRNELVKMIHGVRTNQFKNMPDDLKNILLEGNNVSWAHLTVIDHPEGAEFKKYGDVGLSENEKVAVARWVERDKKTLEDTRKHLLKMLHDKWIAQQKEQGRVKPKTQEGDPVVSGIINAANALVEELEDVRTDIQRLAKSNPGALRSLRQTLELLRSAANEVVSAIDGLNDEAGEVGRNSVDHESAVGSADANADSAAAGLPPASTDECDSPADERG